MDLEALKDPEISNFIIENRENDLNSILFKKDGPESWPWPDIASQIEAYQKTKNKWPELRQINGILFPPRISVEQSSSELTANFKSGLLKGKKAVDLTGGFGLDSIYLCRSFENLHYVEKSKELCNIMHHNSELLGISSQIHIHNMSAEAFIANNNLDFDLAYIDPARRSEIGKKVFRFEDCSPNVLQIKKELQKYSANILIKASPMIDITLGINQLERINKIFVLADSRECKEVLFLLNDNVKSQIQIESHQLDSGKTFSFNYQSEKGLNVEYCDAKKYLYIPGPSIIKGGGIKSLAKEFFLEGINPNTLILSSDNIYSNFPGKIFQVENTYPFSKAEIDKTKSYTIILKNSSIDKRALMSKLKIKEGNDRTLLCYRDYQNRVMISICLNPLN